MKKVVSAFLAVAIILSTIPGAVFASNIEEDVDSVSEQVLNLEQEKAIEIEEKGGEQSYEEKLVEDAKVDKLILKLRNNSIEDISVLLDEIEIISSEVLYISDLPDDEYTVITLSEKVPFEEIETILRGYVEYVQPDFELGLASIEEENLDEEFLTIDETASELLDVEESKIKVALIDSGIDTKHTELTEIFSDGWNFIDDSDQISAEGNSFGEIHGTHLAGVISQAAPNASIIPIQVFEYGKAYTSDVIRAIRFAENNGAKIVNCSWGTYSENPVLEETIKKSTMLFVAAAGNGNSNIDLTPFYPASYDLENVICVTSVDDNGNLSYFSNYGNCVDYVAVGTGVTSTAPNNSYAKMSGTSVSAAYVTGAVAQYCDSIMMTLNEDSSEAINESVDVEILPIKPFSMSDLPDEDSSISSVENIAVAAGSSHFLVLKEDGTVWGWGSNYFGQVGCSTSGVIDAPTQVAGLTDVVAIYAGYYQSFAVKSDGSLWGWGYNSYGELGDGTQVSKTTPVQISVPDTSPIKKVVPGNRHTMILLENGRVLETGSVPVMIGDKIGGVTPTFVSKVENVIDIATSTQSLALTSDGTYWTWGDGKDPRKGTAPSGTIGIAAGKSHSALVTSSHTVYTWGNNTYGQLGQYPLNVKSTASPEVISSVYPASAVYAANNTTIVIKDDGTIVTLGKTIGNPYEAENFLPSYILSENSAEVDYLSGIAQFAIGGGNSAIMLKQDGTVIVCGESIQFPIDGEYYGRPAIVGYGLSGYNVITNVEAAGEISVAYNTPVEEYILPEFVAVQLDDEQILDIPVTWDRSYVENVDNVTQKIYGKLDLTNYSNLLNYYDYGTVVDITIMEPQAGDIIGFEEFSEIRVAFWTSWEDLNLPDTIKVDCADVGIIDVSVSWENTYNPTLFGTQVIKGKIPFLPNTIHESKTLVPMITVNVEMPTEEECIKLFNKLPLKDISVGDSHILFLMEDGTVWAWGNNAKGQLGVGNKVSTKYPVIVSGLTDVACVSAGVFHSAAVKKDGTVWTWGDNSYGQLGDGTTNESLYPIQVKDENGKGYLQHIIQVQVGRTHTLALNSNGEVYVWGSSGNNCVLATDKTITRTLPKRIPLPYTTSIAVGDSSNLALSEKGVVWAWGDGMALGADGYTLPLAQPTKYGTDIVAISAGDQAYTILDNAGKVYYWGNMRFLYLELDRPHLQGFGGDHIVNIGSGYNVCFAINDSGKLYIWGDNTSYLLQRGNPSEYTQSPVTKKHPSGGIIQDVKCFSCNRFAVVGTEDGSIITWGSGSGVFESSIAGPMLNNPVFVREKLVQNEIVSAISDFTLTVPSNTPKEQLNLPLACTVTLNDETVMSLPIVWDTSGYDSTCVDQVQILSGTIMLPTYITNPNNIQGQVEITVKSDNTVDILPLSISVPQNIWLAPTDKIHAFGIPDTVELPSTAPITISGETTELPVIWDTSVYDPAQTGLQIINGMFELPADSDLVLPEDLQATLEITVLPKEYEVWDAAPLEITLTTPPGTTIAELNALLKSEGKAELDVQVVDLETELEKLTFCDITLTEQDNPTYNGDIIGEHTLVARMPENFTPLADDIPGPISVKVTIAPAEIDSVEMVQMDAYQSVSVENLTAIPTQVNATLVNGNVIPIDVEWDWSGYNKDTAGEQIILGELKNIPNVAVLPIGKDIRPTLVVNVIHVDYTISSLLSDNLFEADASLTLEEITQVIKPTLRLKIDSVTEGISASTEYEVDVSLETEKNPEFDPAYSDLYILTGTLALPSNITGSGYDEILLQTNAVEVLEVEPAYAVTIEGTNFTDITGLPGQVSVTLSSVGPDGVHKKAVVDVDWGNGEGYSSSPTEWNEDGTAVMEVTGTLTNCPQYINGAGVETKLYITVTQAFDLVAITPNRFPTSNSLVVKLGSSLEDIYNLLETHSVQLTLQNSRGETSTASATFQLREADNPNYDPLTVGEITLNAYLPLDSEIRNPDNLGISIVVTLTKYTISNTKAVRITGVVSGTPFEDVGLPELATVVRNDGESDNVPVTWNGSNYNPTKIGSQVVRGTLNTPLPVHLENPNNRQPNAVVTIVDPAARILSLEQIHDDISTFAMNAEDEERFPGLIEYRYLAEILYEDGTITTEIISIFVDCE